MLHRMECSSLFLLVLLISGFMYSGVVNSIGINYGQIANNLPPPEDVVPLAKSIGITRIKLYDADPKVLKAFADTGVEFTVCLGNEYLAKIQDPGKALDWVKTNVQAYLPATKITSIFVGNEVLTFMDKTMTGNLLPAMQSIHTALVTLNLDKQVTITTTHSLSILETSFPPSAGTFRKDLKNCVAAILDFHARTGSPFLINAYPYFAYKSDPKKIPLDYVLFQPNAGSLDPATNLHYDNMLFAQIDAVYAAVGSLGFKKVRVHISETGWPSKGDEDEPGATPENAKKYNGNLIKLICQNKGTPLKPNADLKIYVFALFNENMKPGPSSERNFGLLKPDGTPAYSLGFALNSSSGGKGNSSSSSGSGQGGINPITIGSSPPGSSSSNGYLSISSAPATERYHLIGLIPMLWTVLLLIKAEGNPECSIRKIRCEWIVGKGGKVEEGTRELVKGELFHPSQITLVGRDCEGGWRGPLE